jgi:hypothetical protein
MDWMMFPLVVFTRVLTKGWRALSLVLALLLWSFAEVERLLSKAIEVLFSRSYSIIPNSPL